MGKSTDTSYTFPSYLALTTLETPTCISYRLPRRREKGIFFFGPSFYFPWMEPIWDWVPWGLKKRPQPVFGTPPWTRGFSFETTCDLLKPPGKGYTKLSTWWIHETVSLLKTEGQNETENSMAWRKDSPKHTSRKSCAVPSSETALESVTEGLEHSPTPRKKNFGT